MTTLALLVCLIAQQHGGTESPAVLVPKRVRIAIDGGFPDAPEGWRRIYSDKMTALILSCPSQDRIALILEGLPKLAFYFGDSVDSFRRRAPSEHPFPELLALEGYELHAVVLAGEVGRALRFERLPEQRPLLLSQLDDILKVLKTVGEEKLQGDGRDALLSTELERLKSGWIATIDSPFHAVLKSPLSDAEMQAVVASIREQAQPFKVIVVRSEDHGNPKQLKELGVPAYFAAMQAGAAMMTRLSYKDQPDFGPMEANWEKKAEQAIEALLRLEANGQGAQPKEMRELPGPSMPDPNSFEQGTASTGQTRESVVQAGGMEPRIGGAYRFITVLVLLLAGVAAGILVWRSRKLS